MELILYLNDRPYRVLDVGEGECQLMILSANGADSLSELRLAEASEGHRILVVDASLAWEHESTALPCGHLPEIAADIHLLIDVYWLEQLRIGLPQSDHELYRALKGLLHERLLE